MTTLKELRGTMKNNFIKVLAIIVTVLTFALLAVLEVMDGHLEYFITHG